MRQRILVIGDAGVNTGFERVVRGITQHLWDLDTYDIIVRGISWVDKEHSVHRYPWTVKPWGGDKDDPCGTLNFRSWLKEDEPDVILIVQDIWNITNYLAYKPKDLPAVVYFPVDTPHLKAMFVAGLGGAAEAVSYTKFGAQEAAAAIRDFMDQSLDSAKNPALETAKIGWSSLPHGEMNLHIRFDRLARYQNDTGWNVIPHGLEQGVFEPRDMVKAREFIGLPKDAFVVLNVNTNQFRKRQDLTLRAFKLLLNDVPNAVLVFHCAGGDKDGWDLYDLARYMEIPSDRVACVHYAKPKLTDDELCWLYNAADVQINTAGGEGWGLTSFEGAACGVPQLVPDWSATRELWKGYGYLLKVADYRVEPRQLNTIHAEIDVTDAAYAMKTFAQNKALRSTYSAAALDLVRKQATWDEVGAAFHKIIQNALNEPPIVPMTKAELLAQREPGLKSEVAGRPTLKR